jgi:hypothetical protein
MVGPTIRPKQIDEPTPGFAMELRIPADSSAAVSRNSAFAISARQVLHASQKMASKGKEFYWNL